MREKLSNGRVRVLVGLVLLAGLLIQCQRALQNQSSQEASPVAVVGPSNPGPGAAIASVVQEKPGAGESLEALAARDPLAVIEKAMDQYDRSVRDYTCVFTKQELLGGELSKEQVVKARFRERPFSVRFEWIKNPDKATKVLYVAGRWTENDHPAAVCVPGRLAKMLVSHVMRPIDGKEARKTSRRTIDQFGVRNSLALIHKYCKQAQERGILDFRYLGKGKVDGRETLVLERRLPYSGEGGPWPDRLLVVHLDKELLLPTLCQAYADDEKKQLLGSYMMTDIQLNVNLPDSDFTKEAILED